MIFTQFSVVSLFENNARVNSVQQQPSLLCALGCPAFGFIIKRAHSISSFRYNKLLKGWVDFGETTLRTSCSQLLRKFPSITLNKALLFSYISFDVIFSLQNRVTITFLLYKCIQCYSSSRL